MTSIAKSALKDLPYSLLLRISLALIYVIATGVAGYLVFARVRSEVANSDILPDFTIKPVARDENSNVEQVEGEVLPQWTGTDPVTVLILGIDERAQEDDYWRTDTMMLARLDPVTMHAGVLSIPRDLWVPIPGYTENRINTAHALGDAYDHPGGGPALAVETVKYNLGIPPDETVYYVRVNFQAFVDMVDLIGGIEIEVTETIDDECYPTPDYGCEHYYLEPGTYHFYGEEALKYARVRHTSEGDFGRARRQQQVVQAILEQVTKAGNLPQLAARAPEIYQKIESSVKIDPNLQLDEIIALAGKAVEVDSENIRFRVIDQTCILFKTTPDNAQILVPLRDKIREVRDDVFWLAADSDRLQTLEEEAATLSVLNGTLTPGLAQSTGEFLEANGLQVAAYDNADRQDYDTSLVILNRDKPMTAMQILSLLHLPESALVNGTNPTAEYDVVVILGQDYADSQ